MVRFLAVKRAEASLRLVSVVMIASAKSQTASSAAARLATRSDVCGVIFSTGSGTPIMPVEEGKTACGGICRSFAIAEQTPLQFRTPVEPVAQLAFPEFTMRARMRPREARRNSRPTSMGAANTRLLVNNAAAVVPGTHSTSAKSGRPLALMPADAAEKRNPKGRWIAGRSPGFMPEASPANWAAQEEWRTSVAPREPWQLHRRNGIVDRPSSPCGLYLAGLPVGQRRNRVG